MPTGGYTITLVTYVDNFVSQLSTQTWNDYLNDKPQQSIHIKYYEYSKPSSLVAPLSEAFAAIIKKSNITGKLSFNAVKHITINVLPKNMTEEDKKKPYLIILPEELIYVLGFDNPGIIFNNRYGAVSSNYGKQLTARRKVNLNF